LGVIKEFGSIYCQTWWGYNTPEGCYMNYLVYNKIKTNRSDLNIDNSLSVSIDMI